MAVSYRSANPFGGGVGTAEPFDIWGAANRAFPDYFPAPKQKAAETAKVVEAAKSSGGQKVDALGAQGAAAPKPQADPFAADWTGKEGFRWKAPPVTTQSRGEAQAGYQGTHDPFSSDDPWNPSGAALTQGQIEGDFAAREAINARNKQAMDAIAASEASRPDPMAEAIKNAKGNAEFSAANVFASDPFSAERFKTDETIRAEQAKAGIGRDIEKQRQSDYMSEVFALEGERTRRLALLRASPEYRAMGQAQRQEIEGQLSDPFDRRLDALKTGTQFGERFAPRFPSGGFSG